MRVYIPTTLTGLAAARDAGGFGTGTVAAHAVTPALREWYLSDDIEELEYAALTRAAQASLTLLAADPDAKRRRVVVAADVDDAAVRADPGTALGAVLVDGGVPWGKTAAVHVDDGEAEDDVAAAAAAVPAAASGDGDAEFAVDGAEGHELLWFGVQEVAGLLGT